MTTSLAELLGFEALPIRAEIAPPQLWSVQFHRSAERMPADGKNAFSLAFSVTYGRAHKRHVAVEFVTHVSELDWVEGDLVVAFRTQVLFFGAASDEELALFLRHMATVSIPSMLFPYVREAIHTLTQRSGAQVLIPMVSPRIFDELRDAEIPDTDVPAPEEMLAPIVKREIDP